MKGTAIQCLWITYPSLVVTIVKIRRTCFLTVCDLKFELEQVKKIGALSVHVGSLSEVSQDTLKTQDPLSIVSMLNRCDCNFAGYAETKAIIFAIL